MNIIIWLAIGGIVGWVASKLMGSPQGVVMDIIVGIAGSFIGAVVLLAVFNFVRRGSSR